MTPSGPLRLTEDRAACPQLQWRRRPVWLLAPREDGCQVASLRFSPPRKTGAGDWAVPEGPEKKAPGGWAVLGKAGLKEPEVGAVEDPGSAGGGGERRAGEGTERLERGREEGGSEANAGAVCSRAAERAGRGAGGGGRGGLWAGPPGIGVKGVSA